MQRHGTVPGIIEHPAAFRAAMRPPLSAAWFALALLGGCASQPSCTAHPASTLHVRFPTGALPVVDASLDGASVPMVIDTGASASFVTPQAVHRIGLAVSKKADVSGYGAAGPTRSRMAEIKDFRLSQHVHGRLRMPVTGLADRSAAREVYLGGVIGNNVLGQFDVDIDLARNRITLTPSDACRHPRAKAATQNTKPHTIHYRRAITGSPEFPVTVDGIWIKAILDTGSTRTVMPRSLFEQSGLAAQAVGPIAKIGTLSAGAKRVMLTFYRLHRARIAGIDWPDPVIAVGGATSRIGHFLIIGNDFTQYHRITIDRRSETLTIEPED